MRKAVTKPKIQEEGNARALGLNHHARFMRMLGNLMFRPDGSETPNGPKHGLHEDKRGAADLITALVDASPDVMMLIDQDGLVTFANATARAKTPLKNVDPVPNVAWQNFIPPSVHPSVDRGLKKALDGRANRYRVEEKMPAGDSVWWNVSMTPLRDDDNCCAHVLLVARDYTQDHVRTDRIKWNAKHDSLTGLPNRHAFTSCLERIVRRSADGDSRFALLLVDVDQLQIVNEAFSTEAGDALLLAVAKRLRGRVRKVNPVARIGEDEFAVVLTDLENLEEIPNIVSRIKSEAGKPLRHGKEVIDFRLSVGIALYPAHGEHAEDVMRSAEVALSESKQAGGAGMAMFEPQMRSRICEKAVMINTAKDILRDDRLVPFYQPKVVLKTGLTAGFEALFRYRHPTLGIQGPAAVAAAMGDGSTAAQIGERVQRLVLADMREWLQLGIDFGHVAINVADAEFQEQGFAERLLELLQTFEVPASRLKLEITESVLLDSRPNQAGRTLDMLNAAGVRLSLDDFGTGYASLVHLKRFPVHEIKIDRSFVRDLPDPNAAAIVRAMLGLGDNLGIAVVAEGVEEPAQARFLREEGCRFAQGYLFGHAASAADAVARLAGEAKEMRAAG